MSAVEFEQYLHVSFPASGLLGVSVEEAGPDGVRLRAPLETNVNVAATAFGGSLSTLAILSAWSWLRLRLDDLGFGGGLVIQRNTVEYLAPATGDFEAHAHAPAPEAWARFEHILSRRGRARIELRADVHSEGLHVVRFSGQYVALRDAETRQPAAGGGEQGRHGDGASLPADLSFIIGGR